MREKGRITKYVEDRGFGFIRRHSGPPDIFFHCRQFTGNAQDIQVGADVEFEIEQHDKGLRAVEIVLSA